MPCVSQMPIVLVPLHFDRQLETETRIRPSCQRSIVIRTFITSDFMTGVPAVPGQDIPIQVAITNGQLLANRLFAGCTRNG